MTAPSFPEATARVQRVWSAIRQLRRFTLADLVAVSESPRRFVQRRLCLWRHYGIVHVDNDGFRLALDLGPKPPFVRKNGEAFNRNGGAVLPPVAFEKMPGSKKGRAKPPGSGRKKLPVPRSAEYRRTSNRLYMRRHRAKRRAQES